MFTMIKVKRPAFLQRLLKLRRRLAGIAIRRSTERYLKQQGWRLATFSKGAEWQGWYRTRYGSYKGRVVASTPNPHFYLYNPPKALLKPEHPHSACFSSQGNGWYSVHFKRVPGDLDSGVMTITRILGESLRFK